MGKIKGQREYDKFKAGEKLSPKKAILAQCYICNGFEDSNTDCLGVDCPLHAFQPYRGVKKLKKALLADIDTKETAVPS